MPHNVQSNGDPLRMSEPMSSVEIEDVLSSIRRLVSDDLRPQPRPARETPAAAPAPAADKLVLTPALRIVPEAEPRAAAPQGDEMEFHSIRSAVEEARFVAVEDDAAEVEAEAYDAEADDRAGYDDDGAAAPLDIPPSIPEAVFAEAEPAPAAPQPEAASDWADEAEAAIRAELEQDTVTEAYARFLDEPEEEPAFDEAAMRELVRDIIREELQGTLGERITRNVRKLVRAEIARALAVRDFD